MPADSVDSSSVSYASQSPSFSSDWSSRSSSKKMTHEQKSKDYNRKLLVSLGMLLPAIAAIIGVVAWAISAEVVMGAKREAARRQAGSTLRLHNKKFDYSKFTNTPFSPLPTQEMLVDHNALKDIYDPNRSKGDADFLQQHMHAIDKDIANRRMDVSGDDTSSFKRSPENTQFNHSLLNEKLKSSLTQENIAQLLEKLLGSHMTRNVKTPKIVVVAPLTSQMKNISKASVETKVTTTKPKAFELRVSAPKDDKPPSKKNVLPGKKKAAPSSTSAPITNRKRVVANSKKKSSPNPPTIGAKSVTTKSNKNYKAKIYEKEIDILLQKIEKLEKQQNINSDKHSIPEKVANSKLLNGKPADIASKIKSFMSGTNSAIESDDKKSEQEPNEWEGMPPPPPPPPPMPFMPFMLPMHPSYPQLPPNANQDPVYSSQLTQQPANMDHYPKEPIPMESNQNTYHSGQNHPQQSHHMIEPNYGQYHPNMNAPNDNSNYQESAGGFQQNPIQFQEQANVVPPNHEYQSNLVNYAHSNLNNSQEKKKSKGGIFKRKFSFSNILNSVLPKNKKKTEEPKFQTDNRNIHVHAPMEPMMSQESQVHSQVDRGHGGYYYEQPGMQMNLGGGPMGGGGQFKVSPMGILKTLVLPLLPKPRMNLNGKVVFGVVLENGVGFGKKPKTVFQHFSTGRIRR